MSLTFELHNDEGLGQSNRIKKAVIRATTKSDQELLARFVVEFYEWRKEALEAQAKEKP